VGQKDHFLTENTGRCLEGGKIGAVRLPRGETTEGGNKRAEEALGVAKPRRKGPKGEVRSREQLRSRGEGLEKRKAKE